MDIEDRIEAADNIITVKQVELREWIIAKCLIDDRVNRLKAEIEDWGVYLKILKKEAGK